MEQQNYGYMKRDTRTGKFAKSATMIDRICENCGITFQIKESRLKYGGGKCCSRKCVDENKKKTYKGKNNPMYGKRLSEETLKKKSKIAKRLWDDDEFVKKVKKSQEKFLERANKDGTWERANKKREKTFLKKIGKKHNWEGTYGERQCDKTFEENAGMSSIEYASLYKTKSRDTSIERKVQKILFDNDIDFIKHWKIEGYEYDIYLPKLNVLIECDGDYWHGKDIQDTELNEVQKNTRENDLIKNKIAKENNIKLFRFWGSEIEDKNFKNHLLKVIWEKK
jgi:G:T-mismatch repair DNA endonuclease (very short patch repair protein)